MTPIKDKSLYPKDWKAIRERILARAGNRCEGSPKYPECRAENGKPHPVTGSMVVLTIAHMDHDPTSADEARMRCLCQRCHNTHDAPFRRRNAARTRKGRKAMGELFT